MCTRPIAIVNIGSTSVESAIYSLTKNVVIEDLDARENIRELVEEKDDLVEVLGLDDEAGYLVEELEGCFSNLL